MTSSYEANKLELMLELMRNRIDRELYSAIHSFAAHPSTLQERPAETAPFSPWRFQNRKGQDVERLQMLPGNWPQIEHMSLQKFLPFHPLSFPPVCSKSSLAPLYGTGTLGKSNSGSTAPAQPIWQAANQNVREEP